MKVLHRALLVALAIPFCAVGLAIAFWACSTASAALQENSFEAIQENASRASVVSVLGKPDSVRECGSGLWWGDDSQYRGPNAGRCVTEERYEYFLTAYGVGYSKDGRAVSKYRYVSE
jgi:hypothetical protein